MIYKPPIVELFCDLTGYFELGVALMVAKAMNVKLRNIDPIGQLGEFCTASYLVGSGQFGTGH